MKLNILVGSLALLGMATHALAQTGEQRVTITGSSIKRIATEGALPVQIITRGDIEREGVISAEQVHHDVVGQRQRPGQPVQQRRRRGSARNAATTAPASANLRGQGSNATLILLNGRRVAAHGLNGDTVDLNQIPMSAIERIEVLKDGASRRSTAPTPSAVSSISSCARITPAWRGSWLADVTQAGGGNIFRGSLVGGWGDLDRDGFNLLATVAYGENKALGGDERDFVNTFQPNRGLSVDTRGSPHATIFPLAGTIIPAAGNAPFVPGTTVRASGGINVLDLPGGPGCGSMDGQAPYDEKLWDVPSAALACAWDTGRAAVLQQPISNLNFVVRGTAKFGEHLLSGEFIGSQAESAKRFSNLQLTPNTTTQQLRFPRNADSARRLRRGLQPPRRDLPRTRGAAWPADGLPLALHRVRPARDRDRDRHAALLRRHRGPAVRLGLPRRHPAGHQRVEVHARRRLLLPRHHRQRCIRRHHRHHPGAQQRQDQRLPAARADAEPTPAWRRWKPPRHAAWCCTAASSPWSRSKPRRRAR